MYEDISDDDEFENPKLDQLIKCITLEEELTDNRMKKRKRSSESDGEKHSSKKQKKVRKRHKMRHNDTT